MTRRQVPGEALPFDVADGAAGELMLVIAPREAITRVGLDPRCRPKGHVALPNVRKRTHSAVAELCPKRRNCRAVLPMGQQPLQGAFVGYWPVSEPSGWF